MGNVRRQLRSGLVALVLAASGLGAFTPEMRVWAQSVERAHQSNEPSIADAALPQEARATLALIRHGGPFPYPKDGIVFGNREHLLPPMPYGYYHEYTVPPPEVGELAPGEERALQRDRARDRGIRRIVCGGRPAEMTCYYTADHYTSFQRIVG